MARYIDADKFIEWIDAGHLRSANEICLSENNVLKMIECQPTADVVKVDEVSEKIIRKKAEVVEYWKNNVRYYRAMQGYSDIEHDTDNFLRGYNEAVEDMLAILDGKKVTE